MNTAQCLSMLGQQLHMLAAFPYGQKQSKLRTRMQSKENMTRLEHPLSFSFSSSRHNVHKSYPKGHFDWEQPYKSVNVCRLVLLLVLLPLQAQTFCQQSRR